MKVMRTFFLICAISTAQTAFGSDSINDIPYCRDIERKIPYDSITTAEGTQIRIKNAKAVEHIGETIGRFCTQKYGLNLDRVKHCIASRSLDYAKLFAKIAQMMEDGEMSPEMWQ